MVRSATLLNKAMSGVDFMPNSILFKSFLSIVSAKYFKKYSPLNVELLITKQCNFYCAYCSIDRSQVDIPLPKLFELIDELAEMGITRIRISGGEPLLRLDLKDIVSRMNDRNIRSVLITNGYLLSQRVYQWKEVHSLYLSLDGSDEEQNINRQKGSLAKVLEGLKVARDLGKPVTLAATLTEKTATQKNIDWLIALAKDNDCKLAISSASAAPYLTVEPDDGGDKTVEEIQGTMPIPEKIVEVIRRLISEIKSGDGPFAFPAKPYEAQLKWPDFFRQRFEKSEMNGLDFSGFPKDCYAGKTSAFIDGDGRMFPCSWTTGLIGEIHL